MPSILKAVNTAPLNETPDALSRLTPLGWRGGLTFNLALLVVSFFAAGYFAVYWRNADMDFMVVYSALSLNDGHYFFFPHPAYLTIISVQRWFVLLHLHGILDAISLSSFPSASAVTAFDAAMTNAIRAARLVSLFTALLFVAIFAVLARLIARDWRVALLATSAFAFSGGMAVHMRILRSEMIAGCFFVFALMTLIAVARRGSAWRPLVIGVASALCMLAMENKIHAILLIAALPVLILPFGSAAGASSAFWTTGPRAWLFASFIAVAALGLLWIVTPILVAGFSAPAVSGLPLNPLLLGKFGVYQTGLLIVIAACMIAFARVWHVASSEFVASAFAVIGGAALGLAALYIDYDLDNIVVVLNPLEEMLTFADARAVSATETGGPLASVILLFSGVLGVLQRYTFVLFTSPRPTVFLTWLIFPAIVYAWRRGERQVAVQAALLMAVSIGVDALGIRRGLKAEYFILTDPLIILSGMLLLDRLSDFSRHRWAYPIGVALIVLHVGVSQAEPVKMLLKRNGPENICDWNQHYLPLLPLPWCDLPPKR